MMFRPSKKLGIALILVVCIFASLFCIGTIGADSGPFLMENAGNGAHPSFPSGSSMGASSIPETYMAGYMTNDSLWGNPGRMEGDASALRVTVSFTGTDKLIIQSDNWLAAGIAAQGPHHVSPPWIDWGYLLLLKLDGATSDPCIQGRVFKGFEWGRTGFWPFNPFDPPVADLVSDWKWWYPGVLTVSSTVTLTMMWSTDRLNYFARIGGVDYSLYSYTPEAEELHYFLLGTCKREGRPLPPVEDGTVKWFQFPGAWSAYNIGRVGWHSYISHPSFIKTTESFWRDITYAYSVDGPNAYLDNTMVWGGATYPDVTVLYYSPSIHFYPYPGARLPVDTPLLYPPDPGRGCPTLFAWNGTEYAKEGILNIHAKSDVTVQYRIQNLLIPHNYLYKLQLRELDNFTSHIDQVKLYAIRYDGEQRLCPLVFAEHSELGHQTLKLLFDDEKRVDLAPTEVTELRFLPLVPQVETMYLVFEINGYNRKPYPI